MHRIRALVLPFLAVMVLMPSAGAAAASDKVLQVIKVSVPEGNVDQYVERVERLLGVQQRLRTDGKMRMWRSTLSEAGATTVIVSIEYDDLNAFATNYARLQADPEWQQIMNGLPAIRKLLSSSLYTEITP